jgi:hypothetical protein
MKTNYAIASNLAGAYSAIKAATKTLSEGNKWQ